MLLWWAQPAIQILSGIYCTLSLWPLLAIWQTKKRKKSISTWLNFFMCLGFQLRGHSITTWTRWGGEGVKNVWFCPRSGYENCPRRGGGGQKMAKFWPRSCWMSPLKSTQYIQEACAKYFAVHILKLKRLKTNSVMFFVSFSKFSNFNMWTAKHLAQASCTELTLKMEV